MSGHGKSHPNYNQGKLVKVGSAANLAEGERLEQFLSESGIHSTLNRAPGTETDGDGPRDIMVPSGGAKVARRVLDQKPHGHSTAFKEEETLGLGRRSTGFKVAIFGMIGLIVFWLVILVFFSPFG